MRRILALALAILPSLALAQTLPAPAMRGDNVTTTATGSTTSRGLPERQAETINARDYGAKGDTRIITGGQMSAAGTTLTVPGGTFTAADVGKAIMLQGAAVDGTPLQGTITGYTSATTVTVSFAAGRVTPWAQTWSASVSAAGTGYVPGNVLTIVGGTFTSAATFTIASTKVVTLAVANGGTGGTNGTCTIQGTTGSGAFVRANGTVTGGVLSGTLVLEAGSGVYTTNPNLTADPVASTCGLVGATISMTMGANAVNGTTPGAYTAFAANPMATTGGAGTGATLLIAGYSAGGSVTYGTDDTATATAAIAAAVARGIEVYFPRGGYWLASQTASIPLNGVSVRGEGAPAGNATPVASGSTILLSNTATAAFTGFTDASLSDIGFWYPMQDGSQAAPIAYPPFISSTQAVNSRVNRVRVLNAFEFFRIATGPGSGLGRVFLDSNLIYCIDKCFNFQTGMADILQLGPNNLWGVGAFGNQGIAAGRMLFRYTVTQGALVYVDVTTGGYKNIDGMQMTGGFVFGYRYGVRMLSGLMNVSTFSGVNWDQVQSPLSMEGTSSVTSTSFVGGNIYSINVFDAAGTASPFNLAGATTGTNLTISGVNVAYAQGDVVRAATNSVNTLNLTGNKFTAFGQSSVGGFYYAYQQVGTSVGRVNISGNHVTCQAKSGSSMNGVRTAGHPLINIIGNQFIACNTAVRMDTSTGTITNVIGNSAAATVGTNVGEYTGTDTVYDIGNAWDRPLSREPASVIGHVVTRSALPALTTGAADCGTAPVIVGNDNAGRVTVGSGTNGGKCTITFAMPWKNAPICTVTNETQAILMRATPVSITAASLSGAVAAGDALSYRCAGYQ